MENYDSKKIYCLQHRSYGEIGLCIDCDTQRIARTLDKKLTLKESEDKRVKLLIETVKTQNKLIKQLEGNNLMLKKILQFNGVHIEVQ